MGKLGSAILTCLRFVHLRLPGLHLVRVRGRDRGRGRDRVRVRVRDGVTVRVS